MNKRQKEVLQSQLNDEKKVLKQLEKQYTAALNDINNKIRILQSDELTQSRIYRIEHQKALKSQVSGILEKLHSDEYSTIEQFLKDSYTSGFIGTTYDLFGQGVPLIMPIDPKDAVRAVMTDSKISGGLYSALGVDVKKLKKSISAEISRGLASDMSYDDIARNISNATKAPMNRTRTIVQTETHRIHEASSFEAMLEAKRKGADIVKQWNSTLDGSTRKTHRKLDGQIKEVEEPFEMNGKEAMYPGDFNDPAEDIRCRCRLLQRARWGLGEDELETLKKRAEFFELDKTKAFEDFKEKYLKAVAFETAVATIANTGKNDIIKEKGAYTDSNDPEGTKRDAHAERYYASMRNSQKTDIVEVIAQNTGVSAAVISKVYDHLLINQYDLEAGYTTFDPDYYIAESLQRLREGKNIQAHDLILLQHEALEYDLMNNEGMSYDEAHATANKSFNYQKALLEWLDKQESR